MHPSTGCIDESGIQHVDFIACSSETDVEQSPTLSPGCGSLVSPGQSSKVESYHDDNVVFASLGRMQGKEVEMLRRTISTAEACDAEVGNRPTGRERS